MKILWLELAEKDLDSIYDYYAENRSVNAANKMYNRILDAVEPLKDLPAIGVVEKTLNDDSTDTYRALLVKRHFKIIYYVEEDNVFISGIWDCRQNPSKIKQIKYR